MCIRDRAGDKDGILPLPGWLMHLLNIIINILRSVPFLILMICVFPLPRIIVGTTCLLYTSRGKYFMSPDVGMPGVQVCVRRERI